MQDNRWRTLAITSPTAGCGKTMVSVNLAFSLARQPSCRVALIDLDLKRSAVAKALGIRATGSIGQFLRGDGRFEDCFLQVAPNLAVGLHGEPLKDSSELVHGHRLREFLQRVTDTLAPDVVVIDLPPMLTTDEAIAVLPGIDSSLLVVAAGMTTAPQIAECERHFVGKGGYLGVVLNKSDAASGSYGY
jgi:MinD-like ATPase involved in chromosome partitioning or flagellar assembly